MAGGGGYTNGLQPLQGGGWKPGGVGGAPGQKPMGLAGLNPAQQNYVQNQGKMLPGMGGGALSGAQQNYINNNWGNGGTGINHPLPPQNNFWSGGAPLKQWNPAGAGGAPGQQGQPNIADFFQHIMGGGGGYGNNYLY